VDKYAENNNDFKEVSTTGGQPKLLDIS